MVWGLLAHRVLHSGRRNQWISKLIHKLILDYNKCYKLMNRVIGKTEAKGMVEYWGTLSFFWWSDSLTWRTSGCYPDKSLHVLGQMGLGLFEDKKEIRCGWGIMSMGTMVQDKVGDILGLDFVVSHRTQ